MTVWITDSVKVSPRWDYISICIVDDGESEKKCSGGDNFHVDAKFVKTGMW